MHHADELGQLVVRVQDDAFGGISDVGDARRGKRGDGVGAWCEKDEGHVVYLKVEYVWRGKEWEVQWSGVP